MPLLMLRHAAIFAADAPQPLLFSRCIFAIAAMMLPLLLMPLLR